MFTHLVYRVRIIKLFLYQEKSPALSSLTEFIFSYKKFNRLTKTNLGVFLQIKTINYYFIL